MTQKDKTPFIIFDGQDGSGKGTQVKLLRSRLVKEGKKYGEDFVFTREPGGVALAEALRLVIKSDNGMSSDAITQFLMFWAARSAWVKQFVVPMLSHETVVFSDRGDSSTYAYQVCAKKESDVRLEREFWRMRDLVFCGSDPSAYFIVDVPAEEARRRSLTASDGEHTTVFDLAELSFYQEVRQGFLSFAKEVCLPTGNSSSKPVVKIIDGARTPEVIHEEIYALVCDLCGWK